MATNTLRAYDPKSPALPPPLPPEELLATVEEPEAVTEIADDVKPEPEPAPKPKRVYKKKVTANNT